MTDLGRVEIKRIDCYNANLENVKQIYTDIGAGDRKEDKMTFFLKHGKNTKFPHKMIKGKCIFIKYTTYTKKSICRNILIFVRKMSLSKDKRGEKQVLIQLLSRPTLL